MDNVPRSDTSVNPVNSVNSVNHPFYAGQKWADGYTVIPGGLDKTPRVKFTKYVGEGRRAPDKNDLVYFRSLVAHHETRDEVTPLLILESPISDALSLCVIDVDYPPALTSVLQWLESKGIEETMYVTTGRKGGGFHLYFRCEAEFAHLYKSANQNTRFGSYTNSEGKVRNCVDLKAAGSYVVCPGAIHKSGLKYEAYWGKDNVPVEKVTDYVFKIPVLKFDDWNEARVAPNRDPREADIPIEWDANSDEWKILRSELDNGRCRVIDPDKTRHICPWCLKNGSDSALSGKYNLVFYHKSGKAKCWREEKWYYASVSGVAGGVAAAVDEAIGPESEAAPVHAPNAPNAPKEQQKNQALVEVLEDIDSSAADKLVAGTDARHEHWEIYNRRMVGAEEKALVDKSNDVTILLAGQQSRREIDERIMREVHAARERVFNVRCRRAPHLVLTWTKNMVGHLSNIDLTCWMASCEDCRPFVLGSLASAMEVYLTHALNAGMVISMATASSAVHAAKYTSNALSEWSKKKKSSPEDINIGNRVSPEGRRETRFPICANSHIPKNTWVGIQVGDEVVYFFCRHPDGGGSKSLVPPVITAKGTVLDRFTIQTEHDIATKVTEVIAALDKHIKNQEDSKPEGVAYKYDILFGSMETVKEINYLRHTVTGRGSHSRNKEEAKERRERDGIKDFQAKVVTKLDGILAELSDMTQTTITTEDPTAGGIFKENKDGKLKMHGINTTTVVNNSIKKGTTKECAPGHNKGKKVRNVIGSSKSSGVSVTSVTNREV